jgi:hypothetical protein
MPCLVIECWLRLHRELAKGETMKLYIAFPPLGQLVEHMIACAAAQEISKDIDRFDSGMPQKLSDEFFDDSIRVLREHKSRFGWAPKRPYYNGHSEQWEVA